MGLKMNGTLPLACCRAGCWGWGMLAAERHGPNVHGTWFHLCLIYSYMILAKWSNKKKGEGEQWRRCKSSFIAGILLFHLICNGCFEKRTDWKFIIFLGLMELRSGSDTNASGSSWLATIGLWQFCVIICVAIFFCLYHETKHLTGLLHNI